VRGGTALSLPMHAPSRKWSGQEVGRHRGGYAEGMLVAEQLFLLLRRDDGRAESAMAQSGYALTGAVLTDLLLAGHISMSDDKDPRVTVTAPGPVGDPVLDAALERLREKDGRKISRVITDGKLDPTDRVAASLAGAGVISVEPKRALGLVPARYPVLDPWPEQALRERLGAVLAGATAQPSEAALLSLLKGLGIARTVLKAERGLLGRRELDRRIDEVAKDSVVGKAVAKAIQAVQAAIMVTMAAAAATSAGSS
jgi:hypothetical protein